ncbi:MAG TPA: hypothetical protein VJ862_02630 [Rhodanobacteraceae bacterium]|nr:hypothetical protein [Rhodanobacteraceae bacterium]
MTMAATRMDMPRPAQARDASKDRGATGWLQLAAAPTFTSLALANALAVPPVDIWCSAGHGVLSLGGMTLMYALMGVFHAGPWLKLVASRRAGGAWA